MAEPGTRETEPAEVGEITLAHLPRSNRVLDAEAERVDQVAAHRHAIATAGTRNQHQHDSGGPVRAEVHVVPALATLQEQVAAPCRADPAAHELGLLRRPRGLSAASWRTSGAITARRTPTARAISFGDIPSARRRRTSSRSSRSVTPELQRAHRTARAVGPARSERSCASAPYDRMTYTPRRWALASRRHGRACATRPEPAPRRRAGGWLRLARAPARLGRSRRGQDTCGGEPAAVRHNDRPARLDPGARPRVGDGQCRRRRVRTGRLRRARGGSPRDYRWDGPGDRRPAASRRSPSAPAQRPSTC